MNKESGDLVPQDLMSLESPDSSSHHLPTVDHGRYDSRDYLLDPWQLGIGHKTYLSVVFLVIMQINFNIFTRLNMPQTSTLAKSHNNLLGCSMSTFS